MLSDIPIQVLPKPRKHQPCNNCGYCCIAEPCQLAVEILGQKEGPCKALEIDGDKRVCGIVRRPAFYMFGEDRAFAGEAARVSCLFAHYLGLGMGCDADDPGA